MSKKNCLVIAGGGTGGHVLAGIAIAEEWIKANGSDSSVEFVGARNGMEERLVPRAGYVLHLLDLGSLNRVSLARKLRTLVQLPMSLLKSIRIILSVHPKAIVGVGGYSSGPVILVGRILKFFHLFRGQIAILEQNSVPGFTNRTLSHFVDLIFAAFPGTDKKFPRNQVILTGNPVRSSMKFMKSANRNPFTIFIFGGSQGAMGINSLVISCLPFLESAKSRIRWIHQTGEQDYQRVVEAYRNNKIEARVEKFIDQMTQAYEESSLLICRSGSSTLSEIASVGRAAIFVPLPTAADNHQEFNARVYSSQGAGILVLQNLSTGETLANIILKLMDNFEDLDRIEREVHRFSMPHSAEKLVAHLSTKQD